MINSLRAIAVIVASSLLGSGFFGSGFLGSGFFGSGLFGACFFGHRIVSHFDLGQVERLPLHELPIGGALCKRIKEYGLVGGLRVLYAS